MSENLNVIKEIEDIISYMDCSVSDALYFIERYRGLSPSAAYKTGWFDGMHASQQGLRTAYDKTLSAAMQYAKTRNSDETSR